MSGLLNAIHSIKLWCSKGAAMSSIRVKISRNRLIISAIVLLAMTFLISSRFSFLFRFSQSLSSNGVLLNIIGVVLAITFTSYALLFSVIPYIRTSLKKSDTLKGIGTWFLFTISIEIISVLLGALVQTNVIQNFTILRVISIIYSFLFILSFILIGILSSYLHRIFQSAIE